MKKAFLLIILVILIIFAILIYDSILSKEEVVAEVPQENSSWKITEYGSAGTEQIMSFSIEGNIEGLVIVDGGYENIEGDVNNILKVIKKHHNVVDAWIITHLDSDHAGVFLNIMKNHPEVKIKKVYTGNMPELHEQTSQGPLEVDWPTYKDFVRFSMENKNMKTLSENDIIEDVIGLEMEVLWSYSEWVDEHSVKIVNNGSLVFKLSGKEDSMIFLADTQDSVVGNEIIKRHKDKLRAEYVQIGHHGNNNFPMEIYDIIKPKIAFIPAPDWIFENPQKIDWYTAKEVRDKLVKKGIKVYSDKDFPVSVIIK